MAKQVKTRFVPGPRKRVADVHGSPVSTRYSAPYAYTGELHEIIIESGPRRVDTAAAEAKAEMNRQ